MNYRKTCAQAPNKVHCFEVIAKLKLFLLPNLSISSDREDYSMLGLVGYGSDSSDDEENPSVKQNSVGVVIGDDQDAEGGVVIGDDPDAADGSVVIGDDPDAEGGVVIGDHPDAADGGVVIGDDPDASEGVIIGADPGASGGVGGVVIGDPGAVKVTERRADKGKVSTAPKKIRKDPLIDNALLLVVQIWRSGNLHFKWSGPWRSYRESTLRRRRTILHHSADCRRRT
jgi:hypothetical protein